MIDIYHQPQRIEVTGSVTISEHLYSPYTGIEVSGRQVFYDVEGTIRDLAIACVTIVENTVHDQRFTYTAKIWVGDEGERGIAQSLVSTAFGYVAGLAPATANELAAPTTVVTATGEVVEHPLEHVWLVGGTDVLDATMEAIREALEPLNDLPQTITLVIEMDMVAAPAEVVTGELIPRHSPA